MKREVVVLGAGIVGTCTALHLVLRGYAVTLVDRLEPGRETSYGNAGVIQREAVEPVSFPQDFRTLIRAAFKRGAKVSYHLNALPGISRELASYWKNSRPPQYGRLAMAHARLIEHCQTEHAPLITLAEADDLVQREGFRFVYREQLSLDRASVRAERLARDFGVRHSIEDADVLSRAEPALKKRIAGAVHWLDPWCVNDPGALVARYCAVFVANGGRFISGDATTLQQTEAGWKVHTDEGGITAEHAVIALGPWSKEVTTRLGYQLPLFPIRGYHRHYCGGVLPRMPMVDVDRGYMLSPMRSGVRITTGAEFTQLDANSTPIQLERAERFARELLDLPTPVENKPWRGARPCTVDMLPIISAASKHRSLWFNFGHGQQGFTLGAISGRLIAEMIDGVQPLVDPKPYSASRFR